MLYRLNSKIEKTGLVLIFSMIISALLVMNGVGDFLAKAEESQFPEYTQISTAAQLVDVKNHPTGKYVLTKDIDMTGVDWTPCAFQGILEGNGYSILNLKVTNVGTDTATTYDGNMKAYTTSFGGLFSVLSGAEVNNLKLVNEMVDITTTKDCFIGSIAGYMTDSTISGCTISARLNITADAKMFGVGGVAGFGDGTITNTSSDVTMICIDSNVEYKEEQFMGGAYGAGFINVDQCNITLDGYDSDHGYVHDGGITGMFQVHDHSKTSAGTYLTNNVVSGKITFFEDNVDRRAYCSTIAGETMSWGYDYSGNTDLFTRDEVYNYSVNLKPDMCTNPTYKETVVAATPDSFGYTIHECNDCGYTYTDQYTIYQDPSEIAEVKSSDEIGDGQNQNTSGDAQEKEESIHMKTSDIFLIVGAILVGAAVIITFINAGKKKKSKN